MAEVIKIKYDVDGSGFDKITAATEAIVDNLIQTGKVSADVGKVIKQSLAGTAEGIADAFNEIPKQTEKAGSSVKSLAGQLRQAKAEAILLAEEFGQFSPQAVTAAKRAAELKDRVSDMGKSLDALNPEEKLQAFSQLGQVGISAFQGLTGAVQLFGGDIEELQPILIRMQGALNLVQGINSLLSLGDVLKNLRLLFTFTAVAEESLAVAHGTEAAAAGVATKANIGFAASLSATGIGAIVVVLGTLAGAMIYFANQTDEAVDANKLLNEELDKQDARDKARIAAQQNDPRIRSMLLANELAKEQIRLLEAQGGKEIEIARLRLSIAGNEKAIAEALAKTAESWEVKTKATIDATRADADQQIIMINLNKHLREQREELENARKAYLDYADVVKSQSLGDIELIPPGSLDGLKTLTEEFVTSQQEGLDAHQATMNEGLASALDLGEFYTEQEQQQIDQGLNQLLGSSMQTLTQLSQLSALTTNKRIADLQRQRDAGIISEKTFGEEVTKLRREQAKKEKELAIFNALINISMAIIKALASTPNALLNIALAALVGAQGAIQLATIERTPLPGFKKGKMPERTSSPSSEDDMIARVGRHEAIIPADKTMAYHPTLAAIYAGKIRPEAINAFVKGGANGRVKAHLNPYDMRHAIRGVGVKVDNAPEIAHLIAAQLQSGADNVIKRRAW